MRKSPYSLLLAGALCAGGWFVAASAQDTGPSVPQEPSVADAARKAKAQKKNEPQAKRVWTEDNIPTAPREIPVAKEGEAGATEGGGGTQENLPQGATSPLGAQAAAQAGAAAQSGKSASADDARKQAELEAKWRQKFAEAHKKLDDDQKDLDLMQREYNLKRQQYYSDPNTAMKEQYNNYGGGRGPELNDLQKRIEDTKQKIEQDKQAIADLEDQLRREGLPPGWSRP
jgi:hypothetical protein